jgi:hypothetical protein
MELSRIEYIRKNGGQSVKQDDGTTKRVSKGQKKGVLYCGIDENDPNSVNVGFSLCNKIDRFDYINGKPVKGFGIKTAKERAEKWNLFTEFFVQKSWTEAQLENDDEDLLFIINPNPQQVVEIPPSIVAPLLRFIDRCKKYYKDKEFPEWVRKFENNEPYPAEELEMDSYKACFELKLD